MKAIIKGTIDNNGRIYCYEFDTTEMFYGNKKIRNDEVFILICDNCPQRTYPSTVSFTKGIHYQLFKFIKENGPCEIIVGCFKFFIDIRNKEYNIVDKEFNTFREAFGYCLMEDNIFWDANKLHDDVNRLVDFH